MQNTQLVHHLLKNSKAIVSKNMEQAFLSIDRKDFVLPSRQAEAYLDIALPIGFGQTISQPTTVAFMLELLEIEKGHHVLDVGCGSGYTTALLSELVGPTGRVIGVDIIPELIQFAQKNLSKYFSPMTTVSFQDPKKTEFDEAPFDRILVSASAEELPYHYLEQLKINGIMVIPICEDIVKIKKIDQENIKFVKYPGFRFVPLIAPSN